MHPDRTTLSRRETPLVVMGLGAQNLVLGGMWEVGCPEKDDKI